MVLTIIRQSHMARPYAYCKAIWQGHMAKPYDKAIWQCHMAVAAAAAAAAAYMFNVKVYRNITQNPSGTSFAPS